MAPHYCIAPTSARLRMKVWMSPRWRRYWARLYPGTHCWMCAMAIGSGGSSGYGAGHPHSLATRHRRRCPGPRAALEAVVDLVLERDQTPGDQKRARWQNRHQKRDSPQRISPTATVLRQGQRAVACQRRGRRCPKSSRMPPNNTSTSPNPNPMMNPSYAAAGKGFFLANASARPRMMQFVVINGRKMPRI